MNIPLIPIEASTYAHRMDAIFYTLVALTVLFTGIVSAMILVFVVRFRRGSNASRTNPSEGNLPLELTWSIIPMLLGLAVYVWSAGPYADVYNPPTDINTVFLIGKQWMWHFQHTRSGIRENNELHLVVNQPVKVEMISQDVIHGFFVPAFRVKRDVLPGRYNTVWFTPDRVGKYYLFCSEYCGTNHSEMGGYIYVMTPQDYAQWKDTGQNTATAADETPSAIGQGVFQKYGCANCHAKVDSPHGPSLYGIYGTNTTLTNGSTQVVDANFIRRMLINPQGQSVAGWPDIMPSYIIGESPGEMSEENLLDLIEYIKSLTPGNNTPTVPSKKALKKGAHVSLHSGKRGSLKVATISVSDKRLSLLKSGGKYK